MIAVEREEDAPPPYVVWDAVLANIVNQAVDESMQIELMYLLLRSMRFLKGRRDVWTSEDGSISDQTLNGMLTPN
jgi:hypothetical protein